MSELIPSITKSAFMKLTTGQLKRLKSCEITSDGEYLFTFVNGSGNSEPSIYLRTQVEYLSQTANAVSGETLEQVTNKELVEA